MNHRSKCMAVQKVSHIRLLGRFGTSPEGKLVEMAGEKNSCVEVSMIGIIK